VGVEEEYSEPAQASLNDLLKGYVPHKKFIEVSGVLREPYVLDDHRFLSMLGPASWNYLPIFREISTNDIDHEVVRHMENCSQFPVVGIMNEETDINHELRVLNRNSYRPVSLQGIYVRTGVRKNQGYLYLVEMTVGQEVINQFALDEKFLSEDLLFPILKESLPN
jgi:hypothetical protein